MTTMEELGVIEQAVKDFVALPDFKERVSEYMDFRKKLNAIAGDPENSNEVRLNAYLIGSIGLKSAFNDNSGARPEARKFPLYEGHSNLTSDCITKVGKARLKMSERFAFKPTLVTRGVKSYYAKVK